MTDLWHIYFAHSISFVQKVYLLMMILGNREENNRVFFSVFVFL